MAIAPMDHSQRLHILGELLRETSRARSPAELLKAFGARYRQIRQMDLHIAVSVRGLLPGQYKITRRARGDRSASESNYHTVDPWRDWDSIPVHTGGLIGRAIQKPEAQLFTDLDLRDDPALADESAGLGSCAAIPLFDSGEAMNWAFTFRREKQGFTEEELEQSFLVSNLVGTATSNLLALTRNEQLTGQLRQQFEEVARVQQTLLPRRLPAIPGLSMATSYLTSDQAGGDYYDFFALPEGRWAILIADVSGHGPAAATVMAMLHAILHGYEGQRTGPEDILEYANRRLVRAQLEGMFVTAFLAVYDPQTRELAYARSGHNPPRLRRRSGHVVQIDSDGVPPLGLFDDGYRPARETLALEPGETLILYTDGITEAFNHRREMFGTAGLDAAIAVSDGSPDGVIEAIHGLLFEHTQERTRSDDQTIVVLRATGSEESGG